MASGSNVNLSKGTPSESDIEKIAWLRHNHNPWKTVEQYWSETILSRMQDRDNKLPVCAFLKKWPVLENALGYKLVSIYCFVDINILTDELNAIILSLAF